jgi:endonuclease YncB( thermonuclease family)
MSRLLPIFLAFACACRPAAAGPLEVLAAHGVVEAGGVVNVATAIDGNTLRLADGRELRLAAIDVPAPDLPRAGAAAAADDRGNDAVTAMSEAARQALAALADGREAQIYFDERRNDRYGRAVAYVVVPPDLWLEAELLRRGLARVHTTRDVAAAAPDMLRLEAEARAAKRGLWALAAYREREPAELAHWLDSFQIVVGHVVKLRTTSGRTWLELAGARGPGAEIEMPAAAHRLFRAAKLDVPALVGSDLRVRGWVRWQDGPVIAVDHPAQIEAIGKSPAEDARKRRPR